MFSNQQNYFENNFARSRNQLSVFEELTNYISRKGTQENALLFKKADCKDRIFISNFYKKTG
ncbi:hypothetical protein NIASO_10280 [Niabella soli DSM 19437]|uniref:Uncharacterized protein n=1 Tax=Niabella soli DSM 19437 TaxID=929713 RepID=W0F875_9BACT|nr:hypothetical protein NIASO_10280 [Niabella soli DSM 19437]